MTLQVSVVLPFRDAAPTLGLALDSLLSQHGVQFELIAVDDGSRDGGTELVARLADRHPNVRLLSTGGQGLVAALELGWRSAHAPLIARMDADDVSLPERLVRQAEALCADPSLGAVGSQVELFSEAEVGGGLAHYVRWQNGLISADDHHRERFVESPLCHPSVMLRAEALRRVGGYREGPFPEDYDLWLRLVAAGYGLAKLPQVLLRWRHHPGQLTFRDARYAPARFLALKAPHLAAWVRHHARPLTIWGAGRTGKQLARALEHHGVSTQRFVDIDPAKIGRTARGAPIVAPEALGSGQGPLLVAVGARGARAQVRAHLVGRGFEESRDFLCAA